MSPATSRCTLPKRRPYPRIRRRGALIASAWLTCSHLASAQVATVSPEGAPLSESAKDEARRRFDSGLALFNEGDLVGARVEFQRAYRLTGHPVVLYNLGLVEAALGNAVAAVEALESLRDGGFRSLGAERAARAEQVYGQQLRRVGELEIRVDVERASLLLDNVDVAKAPAAPLRVTAGSHLLAVLAPGYEPRRLEVSVAGGAREVVEVNLVPHEATLARLTLTTNVPDVEVRVGGELIGRTPLAGALSLKPGMQALELTRSGYLPVRRELLLHEGSEAQLNVELVPSDAGLAAGGLLVLDLSEDNAIVTIDGEPRLDHGIGVPLPAGRHELKIERSGFFPVERDVIVTSGQRRLEVALLPKPDYLSDYVARTERQRTWSYVALGAGSLAVLGGAGYLFWNAAQKDEAERAFDRFAADVDAQGGRCDSDACADTLGILVDDLESKRDRDVFGWIGAGVGAAAVGTGVLLYLLGDEPDRYEPKPESDVFGGLRLDVGPGSATLTRRF